jgi:hypothetical protein
MLMMRAYGANSVYHQHPGLPLVLPQFVLNPGPGPSRALLADYVLDASRYALPTT